jgi:dienelactone hydrolase
VILQHRLSRLAAIAAISLVAACGSNGASTPIAPSPVAPLLPAGFTLAGDPESSAGASWTYQATDGGLSYNLRGMLRKPSGPGPFAAVIISHGYGSNVSGYPSRVASEMVTWGIVCIATNYTHAGGVPIGSPGTASDPGASRANVLRARKLLDFLSALHYVDMTRVGAHGHSMGAFVTTALVGTYPNAFRVASHTAGGIVPASIRFTAAPSEATAATIASPYQMHHGEADTVVPLVLDRYLDSVLRTGGVDGQLFTYSGASHDDVAMRADVLQRVRDWYASHGMF